MPEVAGMLSACESPSWPLAWPRRSSAGPLKAIGDAKDAVKEGVNKAAKVVNKNL
jgi:hypothetical protein